MNTRIVALVACATAFTACVTDGSPDDLLADGDSTGDLEDPDDAELDEDLAEPEDAPVTGRTVLQGHGGPFVATYQAIDGHAFVDGDIDIGPIDELPEFEDTVLDALAAGELPYSFAFSPLPIWGNTWGNDTVPFVINPSAPLATVVDIRNGVANFDAKTDLTFVEIPDYASGLMDHIYFSGKILPGGGASDSIGRKGGRQYIWFNIADYLTGNVTRATVQHEVGHAIGLYHEHQRTDRDNFLIVNWACISPGTEGNFEKRVGIQYTSYNPTSLMHYPRDALSIGGNCPTLLTLIGATLGNDNLSDKDIQGINAIY